MFGNSKKNKPGISFEQLGMFGRSVVEAAAVVTRWADRKNNHPVLHRKILGGSLAGYLLICILLTVPAGLLLVAYQSCRSLVIAANIPPRPVAKGVK